MATKADQSQRDVTSQVTEAVQKGDWMEVAWLMECGHLNELSQQQRMWVVNETSALCHDLWSLRLIVEHCDDDMLEILVRHMVTRGMWSVVGEALQRGVSDSQHRWAVDEACKRAFKGEILYYILPHCADSQLDSVLTLLVERGLWDVVWTVLARGVSDSQSTWAFDEACKQLSRSEIVDHVLRQCTDDQLDSVLTPLVERGLWDVVATVLERGVSDSQHTWAIDEACKHATEPEIADYMLLHCADNQLDSVLTPLVERGLWRAVRTVLQRDVCELQRRWAIDEACKRASEQEIIDCILPFWGRNNLDSILTPLVERGMWRAVRMVLNQESTDSQRTLAIDEICKRANIEDIELCIIPFLKVDTLPQFIYDAADSLLTQLIIRSLWEDAATLLSGVVSETLYRWAVAGDNTEPDDAAFWNMFRNPCYGFRDLHVLCHFARGQQPWLKLSQRLDGWSGELCEVLIASLLESVFEAWFITQKQRKEYKSTTGPSDVVLQIHNEIKLHLRSFRPCSDNADSVVRRLLPRICPLCDEFSATNYGDRKHPLFVVHFIKSLIKHYYTRRKWTASTEGILVILATVPVVPDVQSVALRVLLRHKRWDVISYACLSHVWEQLQRQLFQAAVEQRQWSVVKRWADHSLYDDQRGWALEEAFQEKQWEVFLLLADYGLTQSELMCAHYRLAKHADWDTLLKLFERGGDVTDVKELLTGAKSRKAAYDKDDAMKRLQRVSELGRIESDLNARTTALKTLKRAAKQGDWSVVLFSLQRTPVEHHIRLGLNAAVAKGVWHVVGQLIKLGIGAAQRDSLFTRMVKQRQWGVCMVLLEQGVSVELCLTALPELMDMDQWTLVARVMMYDVDDAVRRRVMQRAIERKQGTVVWQCVITMHSDRLSVEERKKLFHRALSREVLHAIKPLIEVKDATGIQHRDTVLPEAAEQHLWDVVDHCQLHRADIDLKDAEGHTPMHRAARKEDWEAVKALTKRGADPSLLDCDGESVLHRAITAKQWDIVKLLIEYHGDIHQANRQGNTPLQMLIDARQGEMIEHTLMWCPDQWKGVNGKGETALHAVCFSGWPNTLYYLVTRGVDPQAVTTEGHHSALAYAVICEECPQTMVAECIKLGFCMHQLQISEKAHRVKLPQTEQNSIETYLRNRDLNFAFGFHSELQNLFTGGVAEKENPPRLLAPVLLAVISGLPVVTRMLYESGSCSNTELFRLHMKLRRLQSPGCIMEYMTYVGEIVSDFGIDLASCSGRYTNERVKAAARYLWKVCRTPRSLKSSCRLVISRCMVVCRQRHRDAAYAELLLPQPLKNYVMFSDLTDPDYGQHETEGDEEDTDDSSSDNSQDSSEDEDCTPSFSEEDVSQHELPQSPDDDD